MKLTRRTVPASRATLWRIRVRLEDEPVSPLAARVALVKTVGRTEEITAPGVWDNARIRRALTLGLVVFLAVSTIFATGGVARAFELRSPAILPGGEILVKHTCDGADLSPPLRWTDPPAKTRSFALIADDPDAGTWVHWVLYAVPAALAELPEGVAARDAVAGIGAQGVNDFSKIGYGGPCPPRGAAHRYSFKLYALDIDLSLPPGKTKAELLKAIEGHVLGQAELMGRYKRR